MPAKQAGQQCHGGQLIAGQIGPLKWMSCGAEVTVTGICVT